MRHIVNFVITGTLVWIFQAIGWIVFNQSMSVFAAAWANQLFVACVIGFIFTLGLWLMDWLFALVVIGTCGLGCIFYPFYLALLGPAGFWMLGQLLPGWITLNVTSFWHIVLMGVLVSVVRIHPRVSSSSSTSST